MISNPRLTVLMPVFNAQDFLADAIQSVLDQTFRDFELLILNDGSTDSSQKIIEEFAQKDPRIRFVEHRNQGIVKTLNRGIELARTDLIARQDADDMSFPERLKKQIEYLESHPECAVLGTAAQVFFGALVLRYVFPFEHLEQIGDSFLFGNTFVHGSVIFKKRVVIDEGGYSNAPEARHIEDFDLWAKIARKSPVANLTEPLYRYRDHPSSISNSQNSIQRDNTRALCSKIRCEKWYQDYWRISGFDSRKWNSLPTESSLSSLINLQIRSILILAGLREWKGSSRRFFACVSHPLRFSVGFVQWLLQTISKRFF